MKALPTTKDTYDVIWSADPAVDFDSSDVTKYIITGDESHMKVIGTPTRYVFRPLTKREMAYVIGETGGSSNTSLVGYAVCSVGLVEVISEDPEQAITEKELKRARQRRGGVEVLGDRHPIWDRLGDVVTEVGNTAYFANFRSRAGSPTNSAGAEVGPVEKS